MSTLSLPGRVRSIRPFDRDAGRTMVHAGNQLLLLDSNPHILASWPLPDDVVGIADADPMTDTVIFGHSAAVVLQQHGEEVWRLPHAEWGGDFESAGAWLRSGHAWTIVPDDLHEKCELVRLRPLTGEVTGVAEIDAAPSGIELVPFPDGWLGIGLGEGQDAARAWFLKTDEDELTLREAPWDDRILSDVHASGRWIVTTPQTGDGPIQVLSWPDLEPVWEITVPAIPESCWLESAVFVGDDLVAAFVPGDREEGECLRIPPHDPITKVAGEIWPAPGGTDYWLEYDGTRLTRRD
ncbi:MAG: hypothetical protein Q4G45_09025 [Actinomycetia bacterium]|nr:hypothetical protein [Actinomycetes bacterium]